MTRFLHAIAVLIGLAVLPGCFDEPPAKVAKPAASTGKAGGDCCDPPSPAEALLAALKQPGGGKALSQATFGGGVSRNMVNLVDKDIATEWNAEEGKRKNIKWVVEVGSRSYGGPVVHGGRVFVGTNNDHPRDKKVKDKRAVLMCFAEKDGAFLWQSLHPLPPPEVYRDGIEDMCCSTPTVEGDFVYYCTPGAEVICAQVKDGKIVWRCDLMAKYKVFPCYLCMCSPLVVGDSVYIMTGNGTDQMGVLPSPNAPSFVALNKADGAVLWHKNYPGKKILEGQWSNPTWADVNGKGQVIFAGGDGYLYGLEPKDGEIIWKFKGSPKQGPDDRGPPPYFVATPVVHDNKLYIGVGVAPDLGPPPKLGHLYCIDITKKGDVSCKNENFDPKDPANKDSALVWHRGGLIKPPPKAGRPMYFQRTMSTVAVHDGLVYAAEQTGFLQCLDANTGQQYWEHDFKVGIWGSPYWVDGKIYVCTTDGDCHIFPHGKKFQKPRSNEVDGDELVSTPSVVNGVLYIATKPKVYAIAPAK
jgi:outer membrane protein assembly factor BamB